MNPKIIPLYKQSDNCRLMKAQVKYVAKDNVLIDTEIGVISARAAFSCLVVPENGDTVLVNYADNDYYILAVLDRPIKQDVTLSFPADVKMQALNGHIDLVATKNINLMTTADTHLVSDNLQMTSSNMDITTCKITSQSQEIESYSKTISLHTDTLSLVAKRISQKTDILVRWIESVETLNVGNLIQNIRKNYTSHSDQAVITASKDMRIDGERIHMG